MDEEKQAERGISYVFMFNNNDCILVTHVKIVAYDKWNDAGAESKKDKEDKKEKIPPTPTIQINGAVIHTVISKNNQGDDQHNYNENDPEEDDNISMINNDYQDNEDENDSEDEDAPKDDSFMIDDYDHVVGGMNLTKVINSNKYRWKFEIQQIPLQIMIGIIYGEETRKAKSLENSEAYAFCIYNRKLPKCVMHILSDNCCSTHVCYGIPCTNDDIVSLTLDTKNKTISFAINEEDAVEAFANIEDGPYIASAVLHGTKQQECQIELVDSGYI